MATETEVKKSATDILAEIMLRREAKEEQALLNKEAEYEAKDKQRQVADAEKTKNENRAYFNCDHLQGNHQKLGVAPFREIPNLSLHTFGGPSTSDRRRIRCNKCGFKVFPGDTVELQFVRDPQGNKVRDKKGKFVKRPNPTNGGVSPIGWAEAHKIVMKGTSIGNKPSKGFIDVITAPTPEEE